MSRGGKRDERVVGGWVKGRKEEVELKLIPPFPLLSSATRVELPKAKGATQC